ncbi:ABC transporter permease [Paenibacillus sp. CN-4]|uniref:ABC transporter permease n=1 Tax=Paenibacillus nanchangensis TaxID=3348343 RepID=UPI0039791EF0
MRIGDISRMAWGQIKRRKVVTGLCMAGLSIGCAAIIVALSLGESARDYSEQMMNASFKMDEITVNPMQGMPDPAGGDPTGANSNRGKLTNQKLKVIQGLRHVKAATAFQEIGYMQIMTMDNRISNAQVIATDLTMLTQFDKKFAQGSPSDQPGMAVFNSGATYGFIDTETRDKLFERMNSDPGNNEVYAEFDRLSMQPSDMFQQQFQFQSPSQDPSSSGQMLSSMPLRVAGVLGVPSGMDPGMAMYDKTVYVSYETGQMLKEQLKLNNNGGEPGQDSKEESFNNAIVKVDDIKYIPQISQLIQKLNLNTSDNLFQKEALADEFKMVKSAALGVGVFILIIASISIIVAMTMSTHQRRRQIGIMKVLGSNMRQIRQMFITEAAFLGAMGGALGVGLSYLIVYGINQLISGGSMGGGGGMGGPGMGGPTLTIYIPLMTLPIGMAFAIMTGILSGIYPAISASRTNALTAIKRE